MGSGHTIVADNVIHDITVYGSNESVFYKNGEPFVWDRGRELGMVNRVSHVEVSRIARTTLDVWAAQPVWHSPR